MARFTGFDEVYSALYVDFDNIYTRFLEADPEAARAFGMAPGASDEDDEDDGPAPGNSW